MRLHRNTFKLLSVTGNAVNTDQNGTPYRIEPSANDLTSDTEQSFMIALILSQTGGANSPTSKIKLQTSMDKLNWVDVLESTQLTADGSKAENKDASPAGTPLLKWVRVVTVLGGTTKPNHTAEVWLTSDAPFSCKQV
jgi:hypothetical protein